jgi:hypothetical protein
LDSTTELLLPGITYFQVVFTLPDKLSSLALGNRQEVYDLLFQSAWKTLRDVIADEQPFEAAAAMVLHTWNQKLEAHAHVHALVPGRGPSLKGDRRWVKSRRLNVPQCDGRYLCNSEELKSQFRTNFIAGLKRLHKGGKLKLNGEWSFLQAKAGFDDWLKPLEEVTWVAYIEPPPNENCPPEAVGHSTGAMHLPHKSPVFSWPKPTIQKPDPPQSSPRFHPFSHPSTNNRFNTLVGGILTTIAPAATRASGSIGTPNPPRQNCPPPLRPTSPHPFGCRHAAHAASGRAHNAHKVPCTRYANPPFFS